MITLLLVGSSWAQDVPPANPDASEPADPAATPGTAGTAATAADPAPASEPAGAATSDPADPADPGAPTADPGDPAGPGAATTDPEDPGPETGDPADPAAEGVDEAASGADAEAPEPAPVVEVPQWKELRWSFAFEGISLANTDPAYDLFSSGDGMGGIGLRLGVRPLERVEVRAAWHQVRHGATVNVYSGGTDSTSDTDADFAAANDVSFQSLFTAQALTGGLRVDASFGDVFFPYVVGEATLMSARIRLDDDPTTRTNPGQLQAGSATTGLGALGGVELRTPPGKARLQVGWTLEMGYTWLAPMRFEDLGRMQAGGYTVRSGLTFHL